MNIKEKYTINKDGFVPNPDRDWGIEKKKPGGQTAVIVAVILTVVFAAAVVAVAYGFVPRYFTETESYWDAEAEEPDDILWTEDPDDILWTEDPDDILWTDDPEPWDLDDVDYDYVYADNDAFYTRYCDLYETAWESEDMPFGGICIYLDRPNYSPFVTIRRIIGEDGDPGKYLEGTLKDIVVEEVRRGGNKVDRISDVEYVNKRDAATGEMLSRPQMTMDLTDPDGGKVRLILLLTKYTDHITDEDVLVQFSAAYNLEDEEEEASVMEAFDEAVTEFYFESARDYQKGDVKPGEPLFIFCNDERLNEWYDHALIDPPELLYTEGSWYDGYDEETVIRVLKALKTVRIGDISEKHVGGSGRKIYDFIDTDTGDLQSFTFFEDTFNLDGESYDVLDWGELDDIRLKKHSDTFNLDDGIMQVIEDNVDLSEIGRILDIDL